MSYPIRTNNLNQQIRPSYWAGPAREAAAKNPIEALRYE